MIRAVAFLQILVPLAVLGALVALFLYVRNRGLFGIGADLKASPLGIPSRAIDSGISAATGREETLGGMLAEWFNPATRQVNEEMTAARRIKPTTIYPSVNPRDRT